ncbi:MAG: hypothetical protein P1V97_22505 [Planctomycetota bacterium]|nr:hypothetical protein [Planctomycetota bacterium]
MDFRDLRFTLMATSSFQIDIRLSEQIPDHVRTVAISEKSISVQFDQYNWDEGGLYFQAPIVNLADSIAILEDYIAKPLTEWRDCSLDYPEAPETVLSVEYGRSLIKDLLSNEELRLPDGHSFRIGSLYWSQFVPQNMNACRE